MKFYASLILTVTAASLLSGCSKHSSATSSKPLVIDLGDVQVSDGGTNRIDIGDGKVCIVRSYTSITPRDPKYAKDVAGKIAMIISVEQKDTGRIVISDFNELAAPGQTIWSSNSEWSFSITPKLKR